MPIQTSATTTGSASDPVNATDLATKNYVDVGDAPGGGMGKIATTPAFGAYNGLNNTNINANPTWLWPGDLAVLSVTLASSSVTVTGISSPKTGTWTKAFGTTNATAGCDVEIWSAPIITAGSDSLTLTYSSTTGVAVGAQAGELTSPWGTRAVWSVESNSFTSSASSSTVTYPVPLQTFNATPQDFLVGAAFATAPFVGTVSAGYVQQWGNTPNMQSVYAGSSSGMPFAMQPAVSRLTSAGAYLAIGVMFAVNLNAADTGTTLATKNYIDTTAMGKPVVATTTHTAAAGDMILASTAAGPWVLTLPTAPPSGSRVWFKKTTTDANTLTIDPPGTVTVDGLPTYPVSAPYQAGCCVYDGTNWQLFSDPTISMGDRVVTLPGGRLVVFGHSLAADGGVNYAEGGYQNKLASLLRCTSTDNAKGGAVGSWSELGNTTGDGGWASVLQLTKPGNTTGKPYIPLPQMSIAHYGSNDLGWAKNLGSFQQSMRTILSRLMSSVVFEEMDPTVVLTGTWNGRATSPAVPGAITQGGTAGSTSYGYQWVYVADDYQRPAGLGLQGWDTVPSATTTTATGNATLSTTNFNIIPAPAAFPSWVTAMKLYRISGGTSQGIIATITAPQAVNDTGQAATAYTARTVQPWLPTNATTLLNSGLAYILGGASSTVTIYVPADLEAGCVAAVPFILVSSTTNSPDCSIAWTIDGASITPGGAAVGGVSLLGPSTVQSTFATVAGTRTDTATVTLNSATVTDAAIVAADNGKGVTGTGIPSGTYVGTVTAGASFLLSSSPTSQVSVTATAGGTSVTIGGAQVGSKSVTLTAAPTGINLSGTTNSTWVSLSGGTAEAAARMVDAIVGNTIVLNGAAIANTGHTGASWSLYNTNAKSNAITWRFTGLSAGPLASTQYAYTNYPQPTIGTQITSGATGVTSITLQAGLTSALPAGTQLVMGYPAPAGSQTSGQIVASQVVTLSAPAVANATTLTVTSFTANATYAVGTNITPIAHVITATATTASTGVAVLFDGWWIEAAVPPPIIVPSLFKPLTYTAWNQPYPTDSDVDAWDTALSNMCASTGEFSNCIYVNIDQMNKNPALFWNDGLHPNDNGHALMAQELKRVLSQAPEMLALTVATTSSVLREERSTSRHTIFNSASGPGGSYLTSTTWLRSGTKLVIRALPFETIEIGASFLWGDEAAAGYLDFCISNPTTLAPISAVSGNPILGGSNNTPTLTGNGLPHLKGPAGDETPVSGAFLYTVQPQDVIAGQVTIYMYDKVSAASGKTLVFGSVGGVGNVPFQVYGRSLGQPNRYGANGGFAPT